MLAASCQKMQNLPSISSNKSYPTAFISLSSSKLLLLNSSANQDFSDGSIQLYNVSSSGNLTLSNSLSVPFHGLDLAASHDQKLVALSFDASTNPTQILFYNYEFPNSPVSQPKLTLRLPNSGGQQAVNRIGFFTPAEADNFYYLYGTINTFPNTDGSYGNIPSRVFVAKIAKDFSSSSIMFILSYNLGDPNSLATKSDSSIPYNYFFGSSAPTFDQSHNLFIAFPTGSTSTFASDVTYPPLPDAFSYFSGQSKGNMISCPGGSASVCTQPDIRSNSMFVVDFSSITAGEPINNSIYFVPLAWNYNGIPYGATTNGLTLTYPVQSSGDSSSFGFQNNFWSSYWAGSANLGNNGQACNKSGNDTTSANQYDLASVGQNALLMAKSGANGSNDTGYGNEIFQLTGLDIIKKSISIIKNERGSPNILGESDFKVIASNQTLDPFNSYYSSLKSIWLNSPTNTGGLLPAVPYMYSRTSNNSTFFAGTSGIAKFGVLDFGSGSCLPYWSRSTISGFTNFGMDTSWLSSSSVSILQGTQPMFFNAVVDPTQSSTFSFPYGNGAQTCTDVSPTTNKPIVFCANFLTGAITRYNTSLKAPVFNSF